MQIRTLTALAAAIFGLAALAVTPADADAQTRPRDPRRIRKMKKRANVKRAKPHKVYVEMYATSTVPKSECRVFGKTKGKKKTSLLRTITHRRTGNTSKFYTVTVPAKYNYVTYSCRAPGQKRAKVDQDFATQDPRRVGLKASCGSSQPDAQCTVSVIAHGQGSGGL